jgi:hypothetical protein
MKKITNALLLFLVICPAIALSQGTRPRTQGAAAAPSLRAHLYMISFKQSDPIEVTDVSQFKDVSTCQAAAGNAKVTMAREGGSSNLLSVAFVCVEEQPE